MNLSSVLCIKVPTTNKSNYCHHYTVCRTADFCCLQHRAPTPPMLQQDRVYLPICDHSNHLHVSRACGILLGVSSLRWPPTHRDVSLIGMGCCRGSRKLLAICTKSPPFSPPKARGSPTDSIPNRKPTTGGPKSHPSTPSLMTSPTPKAMRNGTSQRLLSMSSSTSTSGARIPLPNTTTTASSTSGPKLYASLSKKGIFSV